MWRTYTGANPLSTRNFNPGRTTVLSGAAGAAQTQTSSATWLSNLGAAISSLDKMNYEPSGVPAKQHIYAANVRPVDALFPGARFGRRLAFSINDRFRAEVAILN